MKKLISLLIIASTTFSIYAQDCTPDANGNVTCNDFNANAMLNIDLRIENKHNASANMPIFTTQNHYGGKYVRNTNCWAYNLDLTCASPWNSKGINLRAGTLITPRHAILAAHYNIQTGDSIRFITKDNQIVRRKVIAFSVNTDYNITFPDIEVVTLDYDVPPTISPCQLLPSNAKDYLANDGAGLPGFFLDQDEKAIVADVKYLGLKQSENFEFQVPTKANRVSLYEPVAMGDSGDPVFVVLNGNPVLVGVITSYGPWGYSLNYFSNLPSGNAQPYQRIDDLIKATDLKAGINTGYKVSFFDFSATAIPTAKENKDRIFVLNRELNVNLSSENQAQIIVTDFTGRRILNKIYNSKLSNYTLPTSGIYIVTIIKEKTKESYKVIAK
ncbi:MAG: T9SS type A sorting domain-containing protein [Bacteroidales bacterium]|nr:T9SS type A sorting domain-containing protein [Bacteroidales bacterium]